MKFRSYIKPFFCMLILSLSSACDNYLDREDTSGIITPDKIWDNPVAIEAVLVNLYDGLKLDDFDTWFSSRWRLINATSLSDEAQGSYQKDWLFSNAAEVWTYSEYVFEDKFSDRYVHIRRNNDFLYQLEQAVVLTEEEKNVLSAEVRFLRALQYFSLAKRYGGVPLITEPQEFTGDTEALQVPRNTEAETYDFIIDECREIAEILPSVRGAEGEYRATRGAALALMSRAALYAGTIARYSPGAGLSGEAVSRGLVCIPQSEAERFFTTCYEASTTLITDGVYKLYDSNPDKVENFYELFSNKLNGNNGEYIFQKQYNVAGGKGHAWDKLNAPFSYRGDGWGCGMAPTLELVEAFEYTDDSDGTLRIRDNHGIPISYDSPYDIFENKDPRLFGSVYLPGSPLKGSTVQWIRGIIDGQNGSGQKYQAQNQPDKDNTVIIDGENYNASGKDGGADVGDASKTGFYQRKFFDETLDDMTNIDANRSQTPWVVFRLGEIYLNLAEACMELGGKEGEALEAVNAIRRRAGIQELGSVSLEQVRHERRVELAFEKHRIWDMIRWRIAHRDVSEGGLSNFRGTALYPWYNLQSGKYTFEIGTEPPKQKRLFLERSYYTRLNPSDLSTNSKLIQNPGYGN
ncbi:RagB/SusD family nutrient uptake outer membrane protein [Sinomicrobium soli]|uniref:RagB/SusD family nutrient uptake outer membrane protein n=1 Tax=Sinomicrobium sp. N-1-3-6 TaxID=2219864 RepID=UPI000DCC0497|nr:RagB/SusD family nutrient uptake outer membrane protein [Sinomicrobium sp. N-1-3-6]RAV27741.1 RagB/SusD family nutrient uptake outer membrane protein [Sinomicrobium sp. N-1-3-6]